MSSGLKIQRLKPVFVELVPDKLEEGVLYISERFRICSHSCCCGCGEEVVTPVSPAEWKLTREGDLVSLWPSVGNWDYACRSHYVIRRNRVLKALPMTNRQIARVHQQDAADLACLVASNNAEKNRRQGFTETLSSPNLLAPSADAALSSPQRAGLLRSLWHFLFG